MYLAATCVQIHELAVRVKALKNTRKRARFSVHSVEIARPRDRVDYTLT